MTEAATAPSDISRDAPEDAIELSERHRGYIFSIALRYMKDGDAADDVTQDALLLAHQNRASFRGRAKFTTWLYRIAQNTSLVHLRRARSRAARSGELADAMEPTAPGPDPEELHSMREQLAITRRRPVIAPSGTGPPAGRVPPGSRRRPGCR